MSGIEQRLFVMILGDYCHLDMLTVQQAVYYHGLDNFSLAHRLERGFEPFTCIALVSWAKFTRHDKFEQG
jgi:hypothetical protein